MKIMTIVGARPQFIKAAAVSRAISDYNLNGDGITSRIDECIVHTGQHYDDNMSQVFFDELEIPAPNYNIGVKSSLHGDMTGKMLTGIESLAMKEKPDLILVYGDTNSTLAGALAGAKLHIAVAHVEAGLRSFNRKMPEEINRVVTDHVSDLLFCPSMNAVDNLKKEGITKGVYNVGDVMYDAVLHYKKNAIKPNVEKPFALASLHRAENTNDIGRLKTIMSALGQLPITIIMPLHPRTKKIIEETKLPIRENIRIENPCSYFEMMGFLYDCKMVITDSGGLQKEAYFFEKKCITLRDETEWIELTECGANRTTGPNPSEIRRAFEWAAGASRIKSSRLYGNGDAAKKIVNLIGDTDTGIAL